MKLSGPDNVVVYYVTAAVAALTILAYTAAGDVTPVVGFLIGGTLMFALYPNKTIALLMGILISAALRKPTLEGFKEGNDSPTADTPADKAVADKAVADTKLSDTKDLAERATKLANVVGIKPDAMTNKKTESENPEGPKKDTADEQFIGSKKLTPAELPSIGGASSPQDVEKLSKMIDKTMDLLKMLPEGFLQNAVK
jgi:hypothetical protein